MVMMYSLWLSKLGWERTMKRDTRILGWVVERGGERLLALGDPSEISRQYVSAKFGPATNITWSCYTCICIPQVLSVYRVVH